MASTELALPLFNLCLVKGDLPCQLSGNKLKKNPHLMMTYYTPPRPVSRFHVVVTRHFAQILLDYPHFVISIS